MAGTSRVRDGPSLVYVVHRRHRISLGPLAAVIGAFAASAGAMGAGPPVPGVSHRVPVAAVETLAVRVAEPAERPGRVSGHGSVATAVLLPGPVGSAYAMRRVSAALVANGWRVVVVDPLGMGHSTRPAGADYSLTAQAARVLDALDVLGAGPVVVAGQGTSASIALRLAAARPERVLGVVSIAGGPIDRQATDGVRTALTLGRLLDTPPGRHLVRRRFARALRDRSASGDWVGDESVGAYLEPVLRDVGAALRALGAMGAAVEPEPIATVLPRVRAPVRLLVGSVVTPGAPTGPQLRLLLHAVRDVRVDTVAGAGELLHEERPEAVASAIAGLAPVR